AVRPDIGHALAHALEKVGKPDEAIGVFQKLVRLRPLNARHRSCLGAALMNKEEFGKAIASFKEAVSLQPEDALAHFNLGYAQGKSGDDVAAIVSYKKAIHLNPNLAEAHCNLGILLRDQGEFAQALAELRQGDELGKKNPPWSYRSDLWVQDCERLVKLESLL